MTPSKYQLKIYEEYDNWKDNRNIFVSAGPGSGKSHTILQLLKRTPLNKKAILTAFNKSIADELKTKVSFGVKVSTIHSFGFEVMRKNLNSRFKIYDEQGIKTYILSKDVIENPFKMIKNGYKKFTTYLFTIAKIYDLYRMNLVSKTVESLNKLADEYSIEWFGKDFFIDVIKVIDKLEEYNTSYHKETMIDFTDMLWFPYKYVDSTFFPKYDVVFIDETQDLNALQRELIMRLRKESGRFIAVGDEKQAIYSFMGSSLDSLKMLQNLPNTVTLPLSISYRFGKNIAEYANQVFPGTVEGYEENPEGIIRSGSILEVNVGDYVICRNNLPLIEVFLELISTNKPSYIMGKDFGKELITILDRIDDLEQLNSVLEDKADKLKERGVKDPYSHKSYISLMEKVNIIKMVVLKKRSNIDELKELFNALFSDKSDNKKITLSTIHKSKGLESDRIFWVEPQLIPSKYATTELEMYQEMCLKFVCITRARKELIIVDKISSLESVQMNNIENFKN